MKAAQAAAVASAWDYLTYSTDDILTESSGAVWIPDDAVDLRFLVCVIAHTGPTGHHAGSADESVFRSHFVTSILFSNVDTLVLSCIHCLDGWMWKKLCTLAPAVHGTAPNDLLQLDYVEIALAASGEKYLLMLRDDHSNYC